MAARGIHAPIVVVKGDGTLMSSTMAKQRPVETILSGPAASVAGAKHSTSTRKMQILAMTGSVSIKRPVIGIGAPIKFFLSKAVKPLGQRLFCPKMQMWQMP
jgi:N-methylhydantoinase A/oxoprolinase/acetone carboxylase beta subunit